MTLTQAPLPTCICLHGAAGGGGGSALTLAMSQGSLAFPSLGPRFKAYFLLAHPKMCLPGFLPCS